MIADACLPVACVRCICALWRCVRDRHSLGGVILFGFCGSRFLDHDLGVVQEDGVLPCHPGLEATKVVERPVDAVASCHVLDEGDACLVLQHRDEGRVVHFSHGLKMELDGP